MSYCGNADCCDRATCSIVQSSLVIVPTRHIAKCSIVQSCLVINAQSCHEFVIGEKFYMLSLYTCTCYLSHSTHTRVGRSLNIHCYRDIHRCIYVCTQARSHSLSEAKCATVASGRRTKLPNINSIFT